MRRLFLAISVLGLLGMSPGLPVQADNAAPAVALDKVSCINTALQETKDALGNGTRLKGLYRKYFNISLATRPVARKWKKMSAQERADQIDYAGNIVVSIAGDLASYAGIEIAWREEEGGRVIGSWETAKDGRKVYNKVVVLMAPGDECRFKDIVAEGVTLSSLIGDHAKLARNK